MEKQFLTDLGVANDINTEITVAALLQKYDDLISSCPVRTTDTAARGCGIFV